MQRSFAAALTVVVVGTAGVAAVGASDEASSVPASGAPAVAGPPIQTLPPGGSRVSALKSGPQAAGAIATEARASGIESARLSHSADGRRIYLGRGPQDSVCMLVHAEASGRSSTTCGDATSVATGGLWLEIGGAGDETTVAGVSPDQASGAVLTTASGETTRVPVRNNSYLTTTSTGPLSRIELRTSSGTPVADLRMPAGSGGKPTP